MTIWKRDRQQAYLEHSTAEIRSHHRERILTLECPYGSIQARFGLNPNRPAPHDLENRATEIVRAFDALIALVKQHQQTGEAE